MNITYFIRDNDDFYPEPCDKASIKIKKDNKIYYCAACWGSHSPSNIIHFIVANPNELNLLDWIISLGYEPVVDESLNKM